jgi:C-terminal processing protease CtpA/Prc
MRKCLALMLLLGCWLGVAHAETTMVLSGSVQEAVYQEMGIVGFDVAVIPNRYPVIKQVFAGTPAHSAGIRPGDVIMKINGRTTIGQSSRQIDQAISDVPGDELVLSLWRKEAVVNTRLVVASVEQTPTVRKLYETLLAQWFDES